MPGLAHLRFGRSQGEFEPSDHHRLRLHEAKFDLIVFLHPGTGNLVEGVVHPLPFASDLLAARSHHFEALHAAHSADCSLFVL
jgi:hypothetical protein